MNNNDKNTKENVNKWNAKREFILNEFEIHLRGSQQIHKIKRMARDQQQLERRRLFIKWYVQREQNRKTIKQIQYELADLLFLSPFTVEGLLLKE